MKTPPIVSPPEWAAAREKLLVKEKELTRARDALAAERRRMPWLAVEKQYEFDGPRGKASLLDLFEGRRQLIVYRAFFEPGVYGWPDHACPGCSLVADQVAHVAHLNARETTLAFASRAPQADIERVKARMGWAMPWYTMTDGFDADFGVDEWHGTNAFIRDGDQAYRTYFVNNRGDDNDGRHLELSRHHRARTPGDLGGLARGLPADPAVQLVELARRIRPGRITNPVITKESGIVIMHSVTGSAVLITGSNRGIGRALVDEALRRGARRVYAGTRVPWAHADVRVTSLPLDVTDAEQIREAVGQVESLDILVNNAGIALYDDLSDRSAIERQLAVNLFGTYGVTRAFLPLLTGSGGAIVNNLSLNSLAPLPIIPAYSISKAAAFSLTQSLRALLAGQGVSVHAVLTGPTDTDMSRGLEIPKPSAESVARAIFDGVEKGEEDIFPDPMSAAMADGWRGGVVKEFERQYATMV
jgi:predicted dithiol-disulfide oxidoreductase (DUF899 family)/NAD(P)-dependent dehydrogenase (short-subunit alcohol dehydrogenase family)